MRSITTICLAAGASLLTACGTSGGLHVERTATTSVSASTLSAASAPRCRVGQLSVRQRRHDGAMGSIGLVFAFVNTSVKACTLAGYPGLGLLTASGAAMPTTVLRRPSVVVPDVAPTTVRLAPGGHAWFYAGYSDVSSSLCPAAARLEVTPPNAYRHLTISTTMAPCRGRINVSPVFARSPLG